MAARVPLLLRRLRPALVHFVHALPLVFPCPAVLVDPLDAAAIADGITEAMARRDELRPRGLERARMFSWDEAALLTRAVYEEAG